MLSLVSLLLLLFLIPIAILLMLYRVVVDDYDFVILPIHMGGHGIRLGRGSYSNYTANTRKKRSHFMHISLLCAAVGIIVFVVI